MGREGTNPSASTTRHNNMSIRYSVEFFDVLTEGDATGFIDEPVVILTADSAYPAISFHNDHDFLGQALMVRTNGKPMVAKVVITAEHYGDELSRIERRYFIGDPGNAVAVRFGGVMGDCKPFALHSYEDDLKVYDLGRGRL